MQMKQIKFLLAFFVLALGGQLKAVTLPETSEGDKVKWYFLQTTRADYAEPTFYTAMDDGLIKGRAQAVYPDVDGMNKQLWKFETEDGEWYTITNCYDGRKLGTGVGPNGESLMMQDAPQAKFKLRDLTATVGYDCFGLETDTPAPGGGTQYRWPSMTGPNDPYDGLVWLVGEGSSTGDDCGIIAVEFDGVYEPATGSELLQTYLDWLPANWESTYLYGTDPGKVSIVNRATGNSISTNLTIEDKYNVPTADGKGIVATTWNILPIAEGQYAISSVGNDKVMRLLNAQTLGSETDELPDTDLNGTGFAWAFSQADTEVGINTVTQQDGNVRVENGRIIAPEGAKVNVFTPEGVEMPADSKLMPGIYIVTVNGKATKILVH